jgi:hypothetical protein
MRLFPPGRYRIVTGAVPRDGAPELSTVFRLCDAVRKARFCDADGLSGNVDTPAFDNRAGDHESLVDAAKEIGLGHAAVVEHDIDRFAGAKTEHLVRCQRRIHRSPYQR